MWALILMSVGPICLYAVIWSGLIKSWYILLPLPGKFSSSAVYALLPIGVAFSMLLVAAVFFPVEARTSLDIWSVLFLLFGGIGLVFIIWCPPFLKPPWVRWLEREYGYGLHILLDEARTMGRWRWEARVSTREGLEGWVQEVLWRRSDDMHRAWLDWLDYYVIRNILRAKRKCPEKLRTLEPYMLPAHIHIPQHREKDYEHHLEIERGKIARRLRKENRKLRGKQQIIVHATIESYGLEETFSLSDLEQACPNVSRTVIQGLLRKLRDQGIVECTGRGRSARWRRV